jgi:hypothetical protein
MDAYFEFYVFNCLYFVNTHILWSAFLIIIILIISVNNILTSKDNFLSMLDI